MLKIKRDFKTAALITAHPDDETLWAGGTILQKPGWNWFVVCLSRADDFDRAVKFNKALKILNAEGIMGSINDTPELKTLDDNETENTITDLLPKKHFDLIITHNPYGEYTRHIRHEETGRAVIKLWQAEKIHTDELWIFAYEDGGGKYYPRPLNEAPIYKKLSQLNWQSKYSIITETYGFEKESWEALTTPKAESFRKFANSGEAAKWLNGKGTGL